MKTEHSALILLFPGGKTPLKELALHHVGRVAKPAVTFTPGRRVATPFTFPGQVATPIQGDDKDHNDPA